MDSMRTALAGLMAAAAAGHAAAEPVSTSPMCFASASYAEAADLDGWDVDVRLTLENDGSLGHGIVYVALPWDWGGAPADLRAIPTLGFVAETKGPSLDQLGEFYGVELSVFQKQPSVQPLDWAATVSIDGLPIASGPITWRKEDKGYGYMRAMLAPGAAAMLEDSLVNGKSTTVELTGTGVADEYRPVTRFRSGPRERWGHAASLAFEDALAAARSDGFHWAPGRTPAICTTLHVPRPGPGQG